MRKFFLKSCAVILLSLSLVSNAFCGVDFDGVDDYIQVTDFINANQDFITVSAWVYFNTSSNDDYLIGYGSGITDGFLFFRDDVTTVSGRTDTITVYISTTVTDYRLEGATNAAPSGRWIHICFTFSSSTNGADQVRLFFDGVEDANSPLSAGTGQMVNPSLNCFIGAPSATGSASMCNGIITEVALWTTVLTAPEIALLASSRVKGIPLQIQPFNLKLYLPMDEVSDGTSGDGRTFKDLSGNGNSGTGVDGANNTGLTGTAEQILSYP